MTITVKINVTCLRALLKKRYTPISHLPMDVIVLHSHACVSTYTVFYCPVFLNNFILRFSFFDFRYFCISDVGVVCTFARARL